MCDYFLMGSLGSGALSPVLSYYNTGVPSTELLVYEMRASTEANLPSA